MSTIGSDAVNFANLCGYFALFAVSVLVLPQRTRRTRKETQSNAGFKSFFKRLNTPEWLGTGAV
jgi:hypothetical protein